MFKNLRTGTKLLILCGAFIVAIGVTTYSLVAEQRIAIDFARKELAGTRYLAVLRGVYSAILTGRSDDPSARNGGVSPDAILKSLTAAEAGATGKMQTAELAEALSATLRELWSGTDGTRSINEIVPDALAKARSLASRIGDDSNLALDPDLDSYYAQNIVVNRLPAFLAQLGEVQTLLQAAPGGAGSAREPEIRFRVLDGLLHSAMDEVKSDIAAAYRGNPDGSLKQAVDSSLAAMITNASAYLDRVKRDFTSQPATAGPALEGLYARAVDSALKAWTVTQNELDRLLQLRIDSLTARLTASLALTGALAALSILIAVMTHRYIVQPLRRLEEAARIVQESRNYNTRVSHDSQDEIGRLASAFNAMLGELSSAHEREIADRARTAAMQSELARVARLTIMGEMVASIAHEINQPLAAIVINGNAGLRWLGHATPDLEEARAVLKRIVNDGHRASQVITSIRAMLKKEDQTRIPLDINELVQEVLVLAHGQLQEHGVSLDTGLAEELPKVMADRVQLQQVILNLVINAAEALETVTDRERIVRIWSGKDDTGAVAVTVEDNGIGIAPEIIDRVFDPFFSTKTTGMGMGLSICRSIVEGHGGRLTVARREPHGSAFRISLPAGA